MRSIKTIRKRLEAMKTSLEEISKVLKSEEYQRATMYQRGIVNALRWVLGELDEV